MNKALVFAAVFVGLGLFADAVVRVLVAPTVTSNTATAYKEWSFENVLAYQQYIEHERQGFVDVEHMSGNDRMSSCYSVMLSEFDGVLEKKASAYLFPNLSPAKIKEWTEFVNNGERLKAKAIKGMDGLMVYDIGEVVESSELP